MTSTIEISVYPLNNDYTSSVLAFLQKLKAIPSVEIHTNGMSTILIGKYENLWPYLGSLMGEQMVTEECVFVIKVAPGRREYVD
jgi:uncharacterized protein YqgV (UPF0045/DUF77 family)